MAKAMGYYTSQLRCASIFTKPLCATVDSQA
jgi:hypothetical protein